MHRSPRHFAPRRLPSSNALPLSRALRPPYTMPHRNRASFTVQTIGPEYPLIAAIEQPARRTTFVTFVPTRSIELNLKARVLVSQFGARRNTGQYPFHPARSPLSGGLTAEIPSGFRPSFPPSVAFITTQPTHHRRTAALARVTPPPGIAVRIFDTPSSVVSAEMPSSAARYPPCLREHFAVFIGPQPAVAVIGTSSS